MRRTFFRAALVFGWIGLVALSGFQFTSAASTGSSRSLAADSVPPRSMREFRGAWIATVGNIDWPSKPGLSAMEQKAELRALMDNAVKLRINALLLQERPG